MLSRDLSIFLVQLSIALSKTKTYPPGHPAMAAAVAAVLQRLRTALQGRTELAIGVARHQLILEGRATDAGHPVLRDLALRLHRNQLVALHLSSGIDLAELTDLLSRLGAETWRQGRPLGLEPKAELERWPHARIQPLELRQLEIGTDEAPLDDPGGHAGHLWLGLAAAAMLETEKAEESASAATPPPPETIARAINERRGNPAYDKVIAGYLLGLSELVAAGSPAQTATLRQRLAGLLHAMDPQALGLLLGTGADPEQRLGLLLRMAKVLPVEAVLTLLEATAAASQQNISHAVLRILQKLAAQMEVGDPSQGFGAEAAIRDSVHQLVHGMSLEDPNPGTYRRLLELLTHTRPTSTGRPRHREEDGSTAEALRILRMSLEVGTTGEVVWRAVDEMVDRGKLPVLVNHLDRCAAEPAAQDIWNRLASVPMVQRLLLQDDVDLAALERVLERLGAAAAEPMLDSLEEAENLTLRRRLLSRLGEMGEVLGPLIAIRLPGKPWYVQRNLLLLMGSITNWPSGFTPLSCAGHKDARVRREAYKLLLARGDTRVHAVTAALADEDAGIIRLGLTAALEGPVPSAVQPILTGLEDRYRDPELVVLGIRVLGQHNAAEARGWLLRKALTKPRWYRRRRLAPKSPVLLAILAALAARWSRDPEAGAVLRLAAAHRDPEIRAAARSQSA